MYLQDHRVEFLRRVQGLGTGQDRAGLPRTRWTIEQEVGETVLFHEPLDWEGRRERQQTGRRYAATS